jgi:hypothetical protein
MLDGYLKKAQFIAAHIHLYIEVIAVIYAGCDFSDGDEPANNESDSESDSDGEEESSIPKKSGKEVLTPEEIRSTVSFSKVPDTDGVAVKFVSPHSGVAF